MNIKYLLFAIVLLSACAQAETQKFITKIWLVKLGTEQPAEFKHKELARYLEKHAGSTPLPRPNNLIILGTVDPSTLVNNLETALPGTKLISHPTIELTADEPGKLMIGSDERSIEFEIVLTQKEIFPDYINFKLVGSLKNGLEVSKLNGSTNIQSNQTIALDEICLGDDNLVLFISVQDAE